MYSVHVPHNVQATNRAERETGVASAAPPPPTHTHTTLINRITSHITRYNPFNPVIGYYYSKSNFSLSSVHSLTANPRPLWRKFALYSIPSISRHSSSCLSLAACFSLSRFSNLFPWYYLISLRTIFPLTDVTYQSSCLLFLFLTMCF